MAHAAVSCRCRATPVLGCHRHRPSSVASAASASVAAVAAADGEMAWTPVTNADFASPITTHQRSSHSARSD